MQTHEVVKKVQGYVFYCLTKPTEVTREISAH